MDPRVAQRAGQGQPLAALRYGVVACPAAARVRCEEETGQDRSSCPTTPVADLWHYWIAVPLPLKSLIAPVHS